MFERCGYYDTVDQAVHWDVYIHIRVPGIQSLMVLFFKYMYFKFLKFLIVIFEIYHTILYSLGFLCPHFPLT